MAESSLVEAARAKGYGQRAEDRFPRCAAAVEARVLAALRAKTAAAKKLALSRSAYCRALVKEIL